jgi:hypothetical protein
MLLRWAASVTHMMAASSDFPGSAPSVTATSIIPGDLSSSLWFSPAGFCTGSEVVLSVRSTLCCRARLRLSGCGASEVAIGIVVLDLLEGRRADSFLPAGPTVRGRWDFRKMS